VSVLVFVISYLVPGDPVALALGPGASAADLERHRRQLGLDQPASVQYVAYVTNVLRGNLGTSLATQRPVLQDLGKALPASIELSLAALMIAVAAGIPLGISAAINVNRWPDYLSRLVTLSGVSMERAWTAVLLQLMLASYAGLLPLVGRIAGPPPPEVTGLYLVDSLLSADLEKFGNALRHLLLPALALALAPLAQIARIMRSRMLEERPKDYIQAAVAQGLPSPLITYKYMLRNALTSTLTVIGLAYGFLLGSAFLVETVFAWPGIGSYGVTAILNNDFPAIAGVTLVMGIVFVVVNTIIDILYAYVDPRIRYAQ
jgi:peptide/nickel transport system permease protein